MKLTKNRVLAISAFLFALLAVGLMVGHISITRQVNNNTAYDYCVEWDGYIKRSNLIYNCYDLATQEFKCDYKILNNGNLMINEIENITKKEEGKGYESIEYGNKTYHNCSRWLKSKHVPSNSKIKGIELSKK